MCTYSYPLAILSIAFYIQCVHVHVHTCTHNFFGSLPKKKCDMNNIHVANLIISQAVNNYNA